MGGGWSGNRNEARHPPPPTPPPSPRGRARHARGRPRRRPPAGTRRALGHARRGGTPHGGAEVGRGERPLAPTDAATPPGERRQARSGAGHRTGRESETRHTTGGARDPRIGQSRDRWGGEESCGRRATREGAGGGGPGGSRERLKSRRAQRGVSPPEAHAHEGGPAAPRNAKRPASIEPAGHPNRGGGHSSAQRGAGTPTRHRPTHVPVATPRPTAARNHSLPTPGAESASRRDAPPRRGYGGRGRGGGSDVPPGIRGALGSRTVRRQHARRRSHLRRRRAARHLPAGGDGEAGRGGARSHTEGRAGTSPDGSLGARPGGAGYSRRGIPPPPRTRAVPHRPG